MASVYPACDPVIERPLAIKVLDGRRLDPREAAVLAADLDRDRLSVRTLLQLMKREFPRVLPLGASDARDSTMLVAFTNQTQRHRFVGKPVAARQIEEQVHARP